jgi:hypothetical protein
MKKLIVIVASLIATLASAAEPAAKKLPTIPLISAGCAKEVVVCVKEKEVRYECDDMKKGGVRAVFTADLNGRLESLRVVIGDSTVYQWVVTNGYDKAGAPVISDGPENGIHADNTCTLDRRAWVRFYEKNLRLPPIQVR